MVRIEHYTDERIPDPKGEVSTWDFHEARNAVVRTCRLHSPTGPMGVFDLDKADGTRDLFDIWENGDAEAVYFVAEDQYNSDRYQYVECDADYFMEEWILDLMAMLRDFPGWGIGIRDIPMAYVLVFADKVMVTGRRIENVNDLTTLVSNARYAITNREQGDTRHGSGKCKNFFFENDKLVCEVDYFFDGGPPTLTIDRHTVKLVGRNPFTGDWMVWFKDGSGHLELADEAAFTKINEWFRHFVE